MLPLIADTSVCCGGTWIWKVLSLNARASRLWQKICTIWSSVHNSRACPKAPEPTSSCSRHSPWIHLYGWFHGFHRRWAECYSPVSSIITALGECWYPCPKMAQKFYPRLERSSPRRSSQQSWLQSKKTHGVVSIAEADVFTFKTKPPQSNLPLTKRNVLKNVATLFDPLGHITLYCHVDLWIGLRPRYWLRCQAARAKKKKRRIVTSKTKVVPLATMSTMLRTICGCSVALFSIPRCLPLFYPFSAQRLTV